MKRTALLLVILLLAGLFAGCSPFSDTQPAIRPAKLTEDENVLLKMFDCNYPAQVFDFTAPADATGIIIRRQQLKDGEWNEVSYYLHVNGRTGRIAIRFDNLADGLHCAVEQNGQTESTASLRTPPTDPSAFSTGTTYLDAPAAATLHTEIPLLIQVRTSDKAIIMPRPDDYPDTTALAEYDEVYVVTAAFTDQPLQ